MKQLKKHENHFCANNDGECICECYSNGYEEGKEYGLNAKQDYADKAYQQGKKEAIEEIKKWVGENNHKSDDIHYMFDNKKQVLINDDLINYLNKL